MNIIIQGTFWIEFTFLFVHLWVFFTFLPQTENMTGWLVTNLSQVWVTVVVCLSCLHVRPVQGVPHPRYSLLDVGGSDP